MSFGGASNGPAVQLLKDPSDMVAPQVVAGLLQKVAMTSMPDVMAELGSRYLDQYAGGFTAEQRKRIDAGLEQLRRETGQRDRRRAAGRTRRRTQGRSPSRRATWSAKTKTTRWSRSTRRPSA